MKRWLVTLVACGLLTLGTVVICNWTRIAIIWTDTTDAEAVAQAFVQCVELGDRGLAARFVAHQDSEVLGTMPWGANVSVPSPIEALALLAEDYTEPCTLFVWKTPKCFLVVVTANEVGERWWVVHVEVMPRDGG